MAKKDSTVDTPPDPNANSPRDMFAVIARKRAEVEAHPTLDLSRKNYALSVLDELAADLA